MCNQALSCYIKFNAGNLPSSALIFQLIKPSTMKYHLFQFQHPEVKRFIPIFLRSSYTNSHKPKSFFKGNQN